MGVAPFKDEGDMFSANADLATDQIIKYTFPPEMEVAGVAFPIDKASSLKDIKVTLQSGDTKTLDSINKTGTGYAYVSLHELGIQAGGKIKSISANCGTFGAGYTYTTTRQTAAPVGRWSENLVEGKADKVVTYEYDVNGSKKDIVLNYKTVGSAYGFSLSHHFPKGSSVWGGNSISVRTTMWPASGRGLTDIECFLVLPEGMNLDIGSVKGIQAINGGITDLQKPTVTTFTATNAQGKTFSGYKMVLKGSYLASHDSDGKYNPQDVRIDYDIKTQEGVTPKEYEIGEMAFLGKVGYPLGAAGSNIAGDIYDLNENGDRVDNTAFATKTGRFTVTNQKNINLTGYMTKEGSVGALPPYDPGQDGSSDLNAVVFRPGESADYNFSIKNTNDRLGAVSEVKAYVPIPSASINGNTSIPQNTDPTFSHYQFADYKWSMKLKGLVTNTDPNVFDVLYYSGQIRLNANGEPQGNPTWTNPTSLTADQLAKVTLIGIKSKVLIPVVQGLLPYEADFKLPLTINVTDQDALSAGLNNTKNIIRPYFFRDSVAGKGYTDGNYVAAKLSVGRITGTVFEDANADGIYSSTKKDKPLPNITVALWKKMEQPPKQPLYQELMVDMISLE